MTTTLPALTGRDWELVEAPACRADVLDRLAAEVTSMAGDAPADLITELVGLYHDVALRQTDAAWWIEHSDRRKLGLALQKLFTAEDKARLAELAAQR